MSSIEPSQLVSMKASIPLFSFFLNNKHLPNDPLISENIVNNFKISFHWGTHVLDHTNCKYNVKSSVRQIYQLSYQFLILILFYWHQFFVNLVWSVIWFISKHSILCEKIKNILSLRDLFFLILQPLFRKSIAFVLNLEIQILSPMLSLVSQFFSKLSPVKIISSTQIIQIIFLPFLVCLKNIM